MSREYGTPPHSLLGVDYGPIGNFVFDEAIMIETLRDYPSPFITSRKDGRVRSRQNRQKTTAADKHADRQDIGISDRDINDYSRRRQERMDVA